MEIKAKKPDSLAHADRTVIETFINVNADSADLTFDAVRAGVSKSAVELPDGTIHQIALDLGFDVEAT